MDLESKLELALKEIERLNQENYQLKQQLADITKDDSIITSLSRPLIPNDGDQADEPITKNEHEKGIVHNYSTPSEKIALYRNLFHGREDVYPVRWDSKAGKSGYSPACRNEWSFVCKKPQVKCSDCSHRVFLPITDEIIPSS